MPPLDPRLAKVLALWSGAATEGERQAARARGEAMAAKAGLTFKQAVQTWQGEKNRGSPANMFFGFDDLIISRVGLGKAFSAFANR
jgi:hypothetical protein